MNIFLFITPQLQKNHTNSHTCWVYIKFETSYLNEKEKWEKQKH